MHYSNFIKCSVSPIEGTVQEPTESPVQETAQPTQAESEMLNLLKEMSAKTTQTMPKAVEDCVLEQFEVDEILETMEQYQAKYFPSIPMKKQLDHRFVFNIPKEIVQAIHYFRIHTELPDILNPAILFYPLFTDVCNDSFGLYLSIISSLIDDNREVINDDAQAYLADSMEGDEMDEDEEDSKDE